MKSAALRSPRRRGCGQRLRAPGTSRAEPSRTQASRAAGRVPPSPPRTAGRFPPRVGGAGVSLRSAPRERRGRGGRGGGAAERGLRASPAARRGKEGDAGERKRGWSGARALGDGRDAGVPRGRRGMRIPCRENGGMRAALERRNGGGDARSSPEGEREGGMQGALEKENEGSPPPPEKGRMEGSGAPEGGTGGTRVPRERRKDGGIRGEQSEGCGSRLGESCALPRNERRDPGPGPCPRCAVLAQVRAPEPRAGVAPFLLSSLPSFSSFPLCFLCLFIAIPPDLGRIQKHHKLLFILTGRFFSQSFSLGSVKRVRGWGNVLLVFYAYFKLWVQIIFALIITSLNALI